MATDPLLRNDFASLRVSVSASNVTTSTAFDPNQPPELIELGETEITLDAPARSCAQGHLLLLKISLESSGTSLEATAKVEQTEPLEGARLRVSASLIQYEETAWRRILAAYQERQNEIVQFLKAARGY